MMRRIAIPPFLILIAWVLAGASCGEDPGKGPRAERGYRQSERIILALENYAKTSGHYPQTLNELVPQYLQPDDLVLKAASNSVYDFRYKPGDAAYELAFRYSGPGINDCTYRSDTKAWKCHGRY